MRALIGALALPFWFVREELHAAGRRQMTFALLVAECQKNHYLGLTCVRVAAIDESARDRPRMPQFCRTLMCDVAPAAAG